MGKNWKDPVVVTESSSTYIKSVTSNVANRSLEVFAAFSLVLTGVAVWDVLSTIWFEWQIITGRRKFRWPMARTFTNIYALWLTFVKSTDHLFRGSYSNVDAYLCDHH